MAKAALWYEKQRPGLGAAFVEEVEVVLNTLRRDPLRFRIHYAAQKVRRILTRQFPCHVCYYLDANTVRVFAIVHAARHERAWKSRL